MIHGKYETEAKAFCEAIKKMSENTETLENFGSYLSYHFDTWLEKYANTIENITEEFNHFANIY